MLTPRSLLERYVEAKDQVRPHMMQTIYAANAVLTIAQSVLPYPWLFPAVLRSEFELLAEAGPAFAFLDAFKMPFDPAV